ncbi:unnamed protein product [Prorocentrum cordatum]|uniref:NAD(P)(+)--arginine ADP-ribosyltransferase n=1 Tax=Prorocentrum cordatum TaxID=2364126 RepID=A0ABN9URE3_9DINO|nr:unnamed protein product [Polarella glacialis]
MAGARSPSSPLPRAPPPPSAARPASARAGPPSAQRLRDEVARSRGAGAGPPPAGAFEGLLRTAEDGGRRGPTPERRSRSGEAVGPRGEAGEAGPAWELEGCFGRALSAAVAAALVPGDILAAPDASLGFIKAVGRKGIEDAEAIRRTIAQRLDAQNIGARLAEVIVERGVALVGSAAASGEALNSKFAAEGGFEFDFGTKTDFFSGLEERIGSPSADIPRAMVDDHCSRCDSQTEWETGNYGITTTSQVEWLLVLQDLFDQLSGDGSKLGASDTVLQEWRKVAKRLAGLVSELPRPRQWPGETINAEHPRSKNRHRMWLAGLADKNRELQDAGEKCVLLVEAIAMCLYTGPLFEKYNAVCRGGPLRGEPSKVMRDRFLSLCGGGPSAEAADRTGRGAAVNRYTTTIHVLASALVKISKLSKAGVVVRGTAGGRLPKQFWEEDAFGVRGGIEYGFMSTTSNREVAMQYASDPRRGAGTILEIQTGMIDRGADLSWISQYPHERELCFPPLTSLQVLGTSVEGMVLVVSLRLNLNLTSMTIEDVIGKRRKVATEMCRNLKSEAKRELGQKLKCEPLAPPGSLRGGDFGAAILRRLRSELGLICGNEADSFNDDGSFIHYLRDALELKQAALRAPGLLDGGWAELAEEAQAAGRTMRRLLAEEGPREAQAALEALERLGALQGEAASTSAAVKSGACEALASFAHGGGAAAAGALRLLARLAEDPDEGVRAAATAALPACCEAGGPELAARAVGLLAQRAEDASEPVRGAACGALRACGARGGPEASGRALELLASLTRDPNHGIRGAAFEELSAWCSAGSPWGAARALRLVAELAQDPVGPVRRAALKALLACCEEGSSELAAQAVELMPAVARHSEWHVRKAVPAALAACCEKGRPEVAARAVALLAELARDSSGPVCEAACGALPSCCRSGGPELAARAAEMLAELATHSSFGHVRKAAVEALPACCERAGSEAAARVLRLLSCSWAQLSADAQAASTAMRRLRAAESTSQARAAQDALERLGAIQGMCRSWEATIRLRAAEELGAFARRGGAAAACALQTLAGLAEDSDWSVRRAACEALPASCGGGGLELVARATGLLSQLAGDPDRDVRAAACRALAACCREGGPELAARAAGPLARLAADSDEHVRRAACGALPAICEEGGAAAAACAVGVLAQLAEDEAWLVRRAACLALPACCGNGGPRFAAWAAGLLTRLAEDRDDDVCRAARGSMLAFCREEGDSGPRQ